MLNQNLKTQAEMEEILAVLTRKVAYNKDRIYRLNELSKRKSASKWSMAKSTKFYRQLDAANKELSETRGILEQLLIQQQ